MSTAVTARGHWVSTWMEECPMCKGRCMGHWLLTEGHAMELVLRKWPEAKYVEYETGGGTIKVQMNDGSRDYVSRGTNLYDYLNSLSKHLEPSN